ncbi:MAG: T9SS type A sorting domain-containing protein [Bacteroidetes bacterium]|nr:T9SS type A sorting domain-containing protein [Bacteroidota bacterium]
MQASNGKIYGTTIAGGSFPTGFGTLFEYDLNTGILTKKINFSQTDGQYPNGSLVQASNGKLYGMTNIGGANMKGVLFEYDINSNILTKKFDFSSANGSYPYGSLFQASNGKLYGMTNLGGANNKGVIFEYDINTGIYTKKIDLTSANGGNPTANDFIELSNGKLLGMTYGGGATGSGVIFEYDTSSNTYTKKFDFTSANGINPVGALILAPNGKFYGMTEIGGSGNKGVIFEYDYNNNLYAKKMDLYQNGSNPYSPTSGFTLASNGKLYGLCKGGISFGAGALIFNYDLVSNNITIPLIMNALDGRTPQGSLMQASNGKFYGMTSYGGNEWSLGVLFEFNPDSLIYIKKYDFIFSTPADGGALIETFPGKLYGMCRSGGKYSKGFIFQYDISADTIIQKASFNGTNGMWPYGSLLKASNGKIYGMTKVASNIFEYDIANDTIINLFSMTSSTGNNPYGSLIEATNGKLYGMTNSGGANNQGTIFEFDISNSLFTKKFDFAANSGSPFGSLIQASDGNLYGLTSIGFLFEYNLSTNIFTNKFTFSNPALHGLSPMGTLKESVNGKLYGMTKQGGNGCSAQDYGVLFEYDIALDTFIKKIDFLDTNGQYPMYTQLLETCKTPFPAVAIGGNTTFCADDDQTFTTSAIAGAAWYNWSFPSGANIVSGDSTDSVTVDFISVAAGTYTITVSGMNACGAGVNSSMVITIYPYVAVLYIEMNDTVCLNGGTITLSTAIPSGGVYSGPGVTGNTFDPIIAGLGTHTIYYTYTDTTTGCWDDDFSNITVELCTGQSGISVSEYAISIFPNPSSGVFQITSYNLQMTNAEIYNIYGERIYKSQASSSKSQVDLSNQPSGIYLLKIITDRGVVNKKIIINK